MWLIAGLGNPGSQYQLTRHNIGFMAIDALALCFELSRFVEEKKSLVGKIKIKNEPLLLVKPQTFMNLSGESVRALADYYKIALDHILIVHDDIDQQYLSMKFQKGRGAGGHNGVKSLIEQFGTNDFARLKLGVGRPTIPQMNVADWVLKPFSNEEMPQLTNFIQKSTEAIETFVLSGLNRASTEFNKEASHKASDRRNSED